jgi:hypothetical protein
MIYELLECRPPFYDDNRKIMFNKILNAHMYKQTMKIVLSKVMKKYGPGRYSIIERFEIANSESICNSKFGYRSERPFRAATLTGP